MSTTEIYADKLIPACDKWLEERKAFRNNLREKQIQKIMSRFLFPVKSREDAEITVDRTVDGFPPNHLWVGSRHDAVVTDLLSMAKASKEHGTGLVNVDEHSVDLIKEYL